MVDLPIELVELKRFHGHLGPYAVIGYRMGQIARQKYPGKIFATLYSGSKRPMSCMADGVQLSSCCTLGKNNIRILEEGRAVAEFGDGTDITRFETKQSVLEIIISSCTHQKEEQLSLDIFNISDEDLFNIFRK